MKIKAKLLTLIIVLIALMSISVGIYVSFNITTDKIDAEKSYLQLYRNSLKESHSELFRFLMPNVKLKVQLTEYHKSIDKKTEAFNNLDQIKILPTISSQVDQALGNIKNLNSYQDNGLKKFATTAEDLLGIIKEISGSDTGFILNSNASKFSWLDDRDFQKIEFYVAKVIKEFNAMEVAYQTSVGIIDEQYEVIEKHSEAYQRMGNIILLSIFAIVMILSVIAAILLAGKVTGSVYNLEKSLKIMAAGDLTHKISIKSKDEIGILGEEMDKFQGELKTSLNKIKNFSNKNLEIKNYLINSSTEASSASVEISANISSVDNQIATLNNNILKSTKQINEISAFTNDLNSHISDQMAMVEQSTASITQMIASIGSVSNLTNKNQTIMQKLQETAKEGDNQINETTDIIEEINSSVHNIGAMAEVIQNISDQTNLLAMNAAIEAAHAGDAGKGFAVVADEIRKLSEASALSSKDIAKNLKDIIHKFEKASVSGVQTKEAFGNIYDNIKNVSNSLLEIASSTSELNIGGTQILEAMDNLSDISSSVQDKSSLMKDNAESVKLSMLEVSDISSVVTEAMSEVNVGFSDVKDTISGLERISSEIGDVSRELNNEVEKFRTRDLESEEEEEREEE